MSTSITEIPVKNTDLGNARRLVKAHGKDLRYVAAQGHWYYWDGKRWCVDQVGEVMRRAKDTVSQMYQEASLLQDEVARRDLAAWAMRSESASRLEALVKLARTEPELATTLDAFDQDQWLLNCLNGTLDLRTMRQREHRREDLITRLIAIDYDPEAQCPLWETFLDQVMGGNTELQSHLQRAIGATLVGENRDQVFYVLYGTGQNGKSTFQTTLGTMLGEYAMHADSRTILVRQGDSPRGDIARLKGARIVTIAELGTGRNLDEGVVKQLTGGDKVTVRHLYQEEFEYLPQFTIFLATNQKPVIRGTDVGIWRRIQMIPFQVSIPNGERDEQLPAKLKQEMPGILAWAVRGCREWQEKGLQPPDEVLQATARYRNEMDVVGQYFDERVVSRTGARTKAADLYTDYQSWCRDNGEEALARRKFIEQMEQRGVVRQQREAHNWYWQDIALVSEGQN